MIVDNPYLPVDRQNIDDIDNTNSSDVYGFGGVEDIEPDKNSLKHRSRYHFIITFNDLTDGKKMEIKESLRANGLPDYLIEKITERAWDELEVSF